MSDSFSVDLTADQSFLFPPKIESFLGKLKGRTRGILIASVGLQTAVLGSMIVMHSLPFIFGDRVIMKVVPVDPRDYLRGDYVVLSFEANRVPADGIPGIAGSDNRWWSRQSYNATLHDDQPVYVTIEPDADGRHWHPTAYGTEKPAKGKYLRGKYTSAWGWGGPIRFGIEAFYVEEGKGKNLENLRNKKSLSAEVAVAPWGQAKLVRLIEE